MKKQKGLSLVELMVSITLGLILMAGVLQVFVGSRATYNSQQAISRVQESGRFAIDFMAKEIRMAGYVGCSSKAGPTQITSTLGSPTSFRWNYTTVVRGYSAAPTGSGVTINAGTEILEVVSASGNETLVIADSTNSTLFATEATETSAGCPDSSTMYDGFCANDILVVSDCKKARIFQATTLANVSSALNISHAAGATPGNTATTWNPANPAEFYESGAEVIKMRKLLFYINNNTAGVPSLWMWDNGVNTELVEGVEDIALTFGIDDDGDGVPDSYKTTSTTTAAEWTSVASVHLELLVRTPGTNILREKQSYSFPLGAAVVQAPDTALRQVFTTTVGVRSRIE